MEGFNLSCGMDAHSQSPQLGASGLPVPEWAIVSGVTLANDTFVGQKVVLAGAGTQNVSLEESQRSNNSGSNVASDTKGGRTSNLRNVLPLDSASGARPASQHGSPAPDLEAAEKGQAHSEHKSAKRTAATGSPVGSLQHSIKSVVPELPAAWQAAAGIKPVNASDASSCCGGLVGGDGSAGRGTPWCSWKWWRAVFVSFGQEIKKAAELTHDRPLLLLPGLAVLAVVMGLGLWALIAASKSEERFRYVSATKIAKDKALYIQTELDKTFMPAYVVSATVQQNSNYYPVQPSNLREMYPNVWYLMNQNFDKLSRDLIALTKAGSVRTVSAIPHGVIRTMYPLKGTSTADDRNWGAIGKNWLNDIVNAEPVKLSLTSRNLTIIGPYNLTQGGIGIVGMQAIFVNASRNETFGIMPGPDGITGPTSSIPGMLDLVWQPKYKDAPRFWGLCTVLISWDALRDNVTNLHDLQAQGYDYVLTRPHLGGVVELAVDWSDGVDPPRPKVFNVTTSGLRPLIYNLTEFRSNFLQHAVAVKVPLPNVQWTLYVTRAGGWVPSWRTPLIVMIVIVSLVLSALVFAVFVSRAQQRRLFRDVVEAAGKLANTTRTLEEEKNRMQALLARHYDLIDLLEGGTGTLAASMHGGGGGAGGGSGEGDGSTRSRIDILRQKMLLTGVSTRREQLGEAEQITVHEMLGEGTFGKVYKGLWRGTEVAIKTIVLPANMSGKEKREKMAVMEAAISSSLAHPNVVQTYTYHIRPLRDSCGHQTQPLPAPAPAAGTGTGKDSGKDSGGVAGGVASSGVGPGNGSRCSPIAVVGLSATASGLGQTQIMLADQGAIVMGSLDTSATITNANSIGPGYGPTAGATQGADAAAAAAAAVAGVAASATGTGNHGSAAAGAAATASRGTSLENTQTGGIHSYEVQLVLEYCDRGCLRNALDDGAFFAQGGLNYPAILETAADVAKAMLHLHLNDVLHGDLKATNVMLKSTGSDSGRGVVAKVADFGLSVRLDHTATHVSHSFQGSLTHMAPEVMLQGHISRAADVYAFGITMWEIFTGGQPYRGTPGVLLGHQTSREGRRPVFPQGTPVGYRELAERCWAAEAAVRPAFSEILDLLTKMRAEFPGPSPALKIGQSLSKQMAAALAASKAQQHAPHPQPPMQQLQMGAGSGGYGGIGGGLGAGLGNHGGGIMVGEGGCGGAGAWNEGNSMLGNGTGSISGSGVGGSSVIPLPKLGGQAAIQVGNRLLSLSAAMHTADSARRSAVGNGSAAAASLAGIIGMPGVLETIAEESGAGDASSGAATVGAGKGSANGSAVGMPLPPRLGVSETVVSMAAATGEQHGKPHSE